MNANSKRKMIMNKYINKNKYKKYLIHMFRPSTCIKLIPNF